MVVYNFYVLMTPPFLYRRLLPAFRELLLSLKLNEGRRERQGNFLFFVMQLTVTILELLRFSHEKPGSRLLPGGTRPSLPNCWLSYTIHCIYL